MLPYYPTPVIDLKSDFLEKSGIRLLVKREDLNHPSVSGNKWWKLRYNLEEARRSSVGTVLTFGGAFSNHIYATAAAAAAEGLKSIGIVRGEETKPLNATLSFAISNGMKLHYISRGSYRQKNDPDFLRGLRAQFGDFYLIPEGGTNELAVRGCRELADHLRPITFDYLCLPVGTGGTMAGVASGLPDRKVVGFSVLKNADFLTADVAQMITRLDGGHRMNWWIETGYHFGGYGKTSKELHEFVSTHELPLDEVYSGKMLFGVYDMIRKNRFEKGATVMALHTGGLQVGANRPGP